ncbi:MAG TPA: ABC transporter ATP-binding protein [Christensenellaceae bacterium]|nr:ABC transporter ATP-binding protein [Christensenellaceae bacterium]
MQNLLEIKDLKIKTLRNKEEVMLLDKVNLNIAPGQCLGIVGESGCGKSITANSLLKLLPYPLSVSSGNAMFKSPSLGMVDLLNLEENAMRGIRGKEIAMIFQEPMTSLDPIFTIERQMKEALEFHHPHMPENEKHERCVEVLKQVNIPRIEQTLASYPHQLSGGQLQRIMIAIALINTPALLIADEPTTALDVTIQAQILELMNNLKHEQNASVMFITHDLGVIAETSEQVAVFYSGHIVEEASAEELFYRPAHPYTEGLIRSISSLNEKGNQLYSIPGNVPPGGELKSYCRFYDRCKYAEDSCKRGLPMLVEVAPKHYCRCFRHSMEVEV